jgi:Spy/CpxP family protein refolding chaperone
MSRTKITTILLAMFAGGIVFGPALSSAESGRNIVAYADPGPEMTYARHAPPPVVAQAPTPPPKPPRPPKAPTPPTPPNGGIKIDFNGHHLDLSGIDGLVRGQLDGVREMIKNNPNIPQPLRDKLLARLDKIRGSVDKRLAKIRGKRLDEVGGELERLGDEIEEALDGLDEELEQLGENLGKDLGKKFKDKQWKFDFKNKNNNDHDNNFGNEDNEDDESDPDVPGSIPMAPDLDSADDGDMRDAINDLKGMAIRKDQKDQIVQIRQKADAEVKAAREVIEVTSKKLETALGNPKTSDAEIGRMVDQISSAEARIRKARIIAWHSARRVLDTDQRKRIEAAATKRKGN